VISFDDDMTLWWLCRAGDYLLWARFGGGFLSGGGDYKIADIWELRDGDFITITDRQPDLPDWFDLHPLETPGSLVGWMKKRLDAGYDPQEPIDGPNLWRVFAGDRVTWLGQNRNGVQPVEEGVLTVVTFKANALVYGEPFHLSGRVPAFGDFAKGDLSAEGKVRCKAGWNIICRLGMPRVVAADSRWCIG
jgi:hypothetical protein